MGLVIKLCLSGMMQGYSESRFIYTRETESTPTRRAVIGMIAAAEGILRDDKEALKELDAALHVKVEKPERISYKLTDFQTVRPVEDSRLSRLAGMEKSGFLTANGKKKEILPLFEKEYITNGEFIVSVTGEETEIRKAADALQHPVFPVYLGRKCCPPNRPVFAGVSEEQA